jgi:hypothetical protein
LERAIKHEEKGMTTEKKIEVTPREIEAALERLKKAQDDFCEAQENKAVAGNDAGWRKVLGGMKQKVADAKNEYDRLVDAARD